MELLYGGDKRRIFSSVTFQLPVTSNQAEWKKGGKEIKKLNEIWEREWKKLKNISFLLDISFDTQSNESGET